MAQVPGTLDSSSLEPPPNGSLSNPDSQMLSMEDSLLLLDTPLPEIEKPEAQPSDEPKEEGWFMKLIHSIFGSSCRCGGEP